MTNEDSSETVAGSGQITVTRDSPDDAQTRQIFVYLDGQQKAELMFGEEIAIHAPAGRHVLRVDNTWNHKDLELNVSAGSDLRFVTKSSAGQFSRFLLVAFGAGPIYVSIEPAPPRSAS
jgi:hypothetical protein